MEQFILSIDQGTTGTTVLAVSKDGSVVGRGYREFRQIFPRAGWVEHDPADIWDSTLAAIDGATRASGIAPGQVAAVGITNQRETTVVWNRDTGKPVHNAIVWQCRRTADFCDALKQRGLEDTFRTKTGLVLDPYFSGTKLNWILNNNDEAARLAQAGKLAFGTVDSFLAYKLSGGAVHVTDVSNASRTLLLNLHTLAFDPELLDILGIPAGVLPELVENTGEFGRTKGVQGLRDGIPIAGMAGDQQSALFGQACFNPGEGKCTFGTGAFMLVNIGNVPRSSSHGLLTTVAWKIRGVTTYAFEGSAFIAGAAVQWLRDGLKILSAAPEIEALALTVPDSGGVVFVPALTGLGAPHWRPQARGALTGITRGTTRGHIARAALEGIALQNRDIMNAMAEDLGLPLASIRVDGGAAANNLLMQLQADLLATRVLRPRQIETTGLGAAFLAGLGIGFWPDNEALSKAWQLDREFVPGADAAATQTLVRQWTEAVGKA
jgi:glycerol kinase